MAEVIFNKLEKVYSNGFKAVHGIDLKIADGEFMVIVGPSGCAKSTTLRMLAGLETISGGEVRIGDKIVNNLAPKSRGIAMVFQNYALYPHMTVRENLAFGLVKQVAEGANRQTGGRSGENSRTGRTARSPAAPALRRPGAARGGGPGDRQKTGRLPVRRTALQP